MIVVKIYKIVTPSVCSALPAGLFKASTVTSVTTIDVFVIT